MICKINRRGISSNKIITFIITILIAPSVLAQITLNDFNTTLPDFCLGEIKEIIIKPLDLNNSPSEISNLSIYSNNSYTISKPYKIEDYYGIQINFTEKVDNKLIVEVEQGGKVIKKSYEINLEKCTDTKLLKESLKKLEELIKENWIIIFSFIVIFIFLIILGKLK